ncbi:MAG: ATP-binding cassette domain-containing protein, partial [Actinomycetota bacterium]|nr:ATP-binding cassette domain-containing protein [Actinomycetota bacterium]
VEPGRMTAVVSETPDASAAIADRLGRYTDGDVAPGDGMLSHVTLDGVRLVDLPRAVVRERILVSDTGSTLFSGILREQLDGGRGAGDAALWRALETASAGDVVEALPSGLAAEIEERGRSLSGGQRQRLALARALVADPEVLVLVEPTSAVDAHTEARIAERLGGHRHGSTTVLVTSSPLLLDRTDYVLFMQDGRVAAEGEHRALLRTNPRYRRVVTRGEEL